MTRMLDVLLTKRAQYPIQRQVLLAIRDIGLGVDIALCIGLALFASPTVLINNPWLHAYVHFVGSYFVAVHRLSVGAIHPEVSQLVFAVGWGLAIIPFTAWFLDTVIYLLVLDRSNTMSVVEKKYNEGTNNQGFLMGIIEYILGPFMVTAVASFTLGDLGIIPHFGWVNGAVMTKAVDMSGHLIYTHMVFMNLYTSRLGLAILSSVVIFGGVTMYSGLFPVWVFIEMPIWVGRMRQKIFRKHTDKNL